MFLPQFDTYFDTWPDAYISFLNKLGFFNGNLWMIEYILEKQYI